MVDGGWWMVDAASGDGGWRTVDGCGWEEDYTVGRRQETVGSSERIGERRG